MEKQESLLDVIMRATNNGCDILIKHWDEKMIVLRVSKYVRELNRKFQRQTMTQTDMPYYNDDPDAFLAYVLSQDLDKVLNECENAKEGIEKAEGKVILIHNHPLSDDTCLYNVYFRDNVHLTLIDFIKDINSTSSNINIEIRDEDTSKLLVELTHYGKFEVTPVGQKFLHTKIRFGYCIIGPGMMHYDLEFEQEEMEYSQL